MRTLGTKVDLRDHVTALAKVVDVIEFDGPLLSLFRSSHGDDYYFHWCDSDSSANRWLVLRLQKDDHLEFVAERRSLTDILTTPSDGFSLLVDMNGEGVVLVTSLVTPDELPTDYLPGRETMIDIEAALELIYETAARGEKRDASRQIFRLFGDLVKAGYVDAGPMVFEAVDLDRLTSFEIKTLLVASRPIARKLPEYGAFRERCVVRLEEEVGSATAQALVKGF